MEPLLLESDQWVTIKDAPGRVQVNKATVYRWVKAGRVRTFRPGKELWLYLPDLIHAESGVS